MNLAEPDVSADTSEPPRGRGQIQTTVAALAKCGATTRSGMPCKNAAMRGRTRCRMHGGKTPRGKASPHYRHGLGCTGYADRREAARALLAEHSVPAGLMVTKRRVYVSGGVVTISEEMVPREGPRVPFLR